MKKVLYVAHLQSHLRNFHYWYLRHLKSCGFEVYVATHIDHAEELSFLDGYFDIPFERNPLKKANYVSYRKLRQIIKDEAFDIIHCHTPVAGILTRLASRGYCKNVYYTAHGFHFYKGAPLTNWLLYFPIEWMASFFTSILFTMNEQDYQFALRHFRHPQVVFIHGAGFDPTKYSHSARQDNQINMISVGELNENKNHIAVIEAMVKLNNSRLHYYIAGEGKLRENLLDYADRFGLHDNVHLLGFRKDIPELLKKADFFVFPSRREGLPVSIMEAMAAHLPCVASDIRGNHDLVDTQGGILVSPNVEGFYFGISKMLTLKSDWQTMGNYNSNKVRSYSKSVVEKELDNFYLNGETDR